MKDCDGVQRYFTELCKAIESKFSLIRGLRPKNCLVVYVLHLVSKTQHDYLVNWQENPVDDRQDVCDT